MLESVLDSFFRYLLILMYYLLLLSYFFALYFIISLSQFILYYIYNKIWVILLLDNLLYLNNFKSDK